MTWTQAYDSNLVDIASSVVALAAIVGLIVLLYAYVVPHLIPHGLSFVR